MTALASRSPKSSPAERARRALLAALLAAAFATSPAWGAPEADPAPGKEAIPFKRDADALDAATLLRTALALGVAIAIALGGLYAFRRFLPSSLGRAPGGQSRINVLEIRRVTPRLTLLLVEIDGQRIFLAQSGDRVRPVVLRSGEGRDAAI